MKVSIQDNADGTYTVTNETSEESSEAVENGQGGAKAPQAMQTQGQQANSLEEAVKIVIQYFQRQPNGIKPNPFSQGFQEAARSPM